MRLTFIGTRGLIEATSPRHGRHSALLVSHQGKRIMIDCGLDWREALPELAPDAVVLTHAHPDHAFGLDRGAPCPVYATAETWTALEGFPIRERKLLVPGRATEVCAVVLEACPVRHSPRVPAVGLRIRGSAATLFYAPDLVTIPDPGRTLAGVSLYIGDGSSFSEALTRIEGGQRYGHAPIPEQLAWCAVQGVPDVLFTHCGEEIVAGDELRKSNELRALGEKLGIQARFAHDGLELEW